MREARRSGALPEDSGGLADWDTLAELGIPLLPGGRTARRRVRKGRNPASLERHLRRAAVDVSSGRGGGREREALQALLLALKLHFPGYFDSRFGPSSPVAALLPACPDGRVLKLVRLALPRLAEYL